MLGSVKAIWLFFCRIAKMLAFYSRRLIISVALHKMKIEFLGTYRADLALFCRLFRTRYDNITDLRVPFSHVAMMLQKARAFDTVQLRDYHQETGRARRS